MKETFQAAAANADWAKAPGYRIILTNQPGEKSWPITAATFILMHKQPTDAGQARRALDFFTWAFEKGDAMAEELDFIPMPDSVVKQIKQTWAKDIQTK
jgi:phosphate transport system substrate-binding protein